LIETGDEQAPIMIIVKAERLKGRGRGRYKGAFHLGFWHAEAFKVFKQYVKEATRKLRRKYPDFKITDETPLWLSYVNGNGKVKGLAKSGICEIFDKYSLYAFGEEKKYTPHDYRDFLDHSLRKAQVLKIDRDPMLSHKMKGVEASYQSTDPEDEDLQNHLREQYKKALPIITKSPNIIELDRVTGTKMEIQQNAQLILTDTESQIDRYEAEIQHWKGIIEVAEMNKEIEPEKSEKYDKLIERVRKSILTAKEIISRLKDSKGRLERLT